MSDDSPLVMVGRATTRDGVHINYAWGPGTGTPVVFVNHLFDLHVHQRIRSELDLSYMGALAAGSPWVCFDWRGAGGSSMPESPITFEGLVDDLEAVVLAIGQRCDIVCWITGRLAVAFARRIPRAVGRMLFLDPITSGRDDTGLGVIARAWRDDPIGAMVAQIFVQSLSISRRVALEMAQEWMDGLAPTAFDQYRAVLAAWPEIPDEELETPLVIMLPDVHPAWASSITDSFPTAIMVPLPEMRAGAAMGRKLREMWDEVTPPSRTDAKKRTPIPTRLTAREREVLSLVARGHSNHEIALRLSIAEATVARHVSHIFEKLDVHTRAAATDAAHRLGLLE